MWGRGGRSLRLECLCLDSVIAGGPTTLALCRVFRLLIKGYTRDHWTHAERDWARGRVGETKNWWNAGQMDVQAMMSVMVKVAGKELKSKGAHTHKHTKWPQHRNKGLFFFFLYRGTPPYGHRFCKKMHVDKQRCDVLYASWAALCKQWKKNARVRVVYIFFWIAKILYFVGNCGIPMLLWFPFVVAALLIWKISQVAGFITLGSLGLLLHKLRCKNLDHLQVLVFKIMLIHQCWSLF